MNKSTSVIRTFGGDVSLSNLNQHRKVQQFESKSNAKKRTLENKRDIEAGMKRAHNSVGNVYRYEWQYAECLYYVDNLEDGTTLNFSELARKFGLKDKDSYAKGNESQIVKQFLIENSVDIDEKFRYHKKLGPDQVNVRRQIKRLSDGNCIPTDPCNDVVKRTLYDDINDGKYEMGELIVPMKFSCKWGISLARF